LSHKIGTYRRRRHEIYFQHIHGRFAQLFKVVSKLVERQCVVFWKAFIRMDFVGVLFAHSTQSRDPIKQATPNIEGSEGVAANAFENTLLED
jgi:hypothetical protein